MGGMLAARTKKRCTPDRLSLPQMYMRQRWYDPILQRFVSGDPIGLAGGANLYTYSNNSPANFIDPSGRRAIVDVPKKITFNLAFCNGDNLSPEEIDNAIKYFTQGIFKVWGQLPGWTIELKTSKENCLCATAPRLKNDLTLNHIRLVRGLGGSTTSRYRNGNNGTWTMPELVPSTNPTRNKENTDKWMNDLMRTGAHEAGHLLGLRDGYREETGSDGVRRIAGLMVDPRGNVTGESIYRGRFVGDIMGSMGTGVSAADRQDIIDFANGIDSPEFL